MRKVVEWMWRKASSGGAWIMVGLSFSGWALDYFNLFLGRQMHSSSSGSDWFPFVVAHQNLQTLLPAAYRFWSFLFRSFSRSLDLDLSLTFCLLPESNFLDGSLFAFLCCIWAIEWLTSRRVTAQLLITHSLSLPPPPMDSGGAGRQRKDAEFHCTAQATKVPGFQGSGHDWLAIVGFSISRTLPAGVNYQSILRKANLNTLKASSWIFFAIGRIKRLVGFL